MENVQPMLEIVRDCNINRSMKSKSISTKLGIRNGFNVINSVMNTQFLKEAHLTEAKLYLQQLPRQEYL